MPFRHLWLSWLAAVGIAGASMKGISYGVSPSEGDTPVNDDFMCDEAAQQWSELGRGDLALIRALGANSVRLYGNDWNRTHHDFLDAAWALGLNVIPGNSDWMYIQARDNCRLTSNYNCREQIQMSYAQNLEKGWLLSNATYHPAINYVVAVNEPDMKLPDVSSPKLYIKAIVSALDGMLEAENEANVTGPLPNFTVTFSWAICTECGKFNDKPGLGQMWEFRRGMLNPEEFDYAARNDLAELYRTRVVNSFNTANPSTEIPPLFLNDYEVEFASTPVFIGEYHWNNPKARQQEDIQHALAMVENSTLLLGISYFEFQMRRDIGGHLDFGMFQPGKEKVADMTYFGKDYAIRCLTPVKDGYGKSLPAQVARAYGAPSEPFDTSNCLVGRSSSLDVLALGNVRVVSPAGIRAGANSTGDVAPTHASKAASDGNGTGETAPMSGNASNVAGAAPPRPPASGRSSAANTATGLPEAGASGMPPNGTRAEGSVHATDSPRPPAGNATAASDAGYHASGAGGARTCGNTTGAEEAAAQTRPASGGNSSAGSAATGLPEARPNGVPPKGTNATGSVHASGASRPPTDNSMVASGAGNNASRTGSAVATGNSTGAEGAAWQRGGTSSKASASDAARRLPRAGHNGMPHHGTNATADVRAANHSRSRAGNTMAAVAVGPRGALRGR